MAVTYLEGAREDWVETVCVEKLDIYFHKKNLKGVD